jgi:hypothetical protein
MRKGEEVEDSKNTTTLEAAIHLAVQDAYKMTGEDVWDDDSMYLYFFTRAFIYALHKHGVGFTIKIEDKKV